MQNTHQVVSIGIDIAKDKFDAAFLYDGNSHEVNTFENNDKGNKEFLRCIKKQGTALTVPCVLESTGQYHLNLALDLHQAGLKVHCINPIITKKYQKASIRNAKTDMIDALRLAEIGLKEEKLPVFSGDTSSIMAKKLAGYISKLEEIKQQLKPSCSQVVMASEIIDIKINLKATDKIIENIDKQIEVLKDKICELAPAEAKILAENTKGLSYAKAAIVLSMLGDKDFTNRDQLIAFVGLDVCPRQSGTWKGRGKLSKRGHPFLRKTLYHIAWGLKQHNVKFKKYYEDLRAGGKNYTTTLIILARKFLRFLYAWYWKNNACPQMSI